MTSDLDTKFPEINYDGTKDYMYKYLINDLKSPLKDQTHAIIFIFAMSLAKRDGLTPSDLKKPAKMPPNSFNADMRRLMRSILIDEKCDVYSIIDNRELRILCEKYANVGIDKLYNMIKSCPEGTEREDVLVDLIQPNS